jgi:hypothetical protein
MNKKTFVFAYLSMGKYFQVEVEADNMNDAIIKFGHTYHLVDEIEYATHQN